MGPPASSVLGGHRVSLTIESNVHSEISQEATDVFTQCESKGLRKVKVLWPVTYQLGNVGAGSKVSPKALHVKTMVSSTTGRY